MCRLVALVLHVTRMGTSDRGDCDEDKGRYEAWLNDARAQDSHDDDFDDLHKLDP